MWIWTLDQEGGKIRGHLFGLPHFTLDASAKVTASTGVRVMGLGLRTGVSKLHPRKAHSPTRCKDIQLN